MNFSASSAFGPPAIRTAAFGITSVPMPSASGKTTPTGLPMFAVVPGGERQRELAYRFGVNLTMFAMTGNYKADQVHVPFILERLGQ